MPAWVAANVVDNLDLLCPTHKAVVDRMNIVLQTTFPGFSNAFDETAKAILQELDVVLAGVPAAAGTHERFASILADYKSSESKTTELIQESPLVESEMTFQTEFLSKAFEPLMRLTMRDTNIVEGPVRPDFVASAVLKHVHELVSKLTGCQLPKIGPQNMIGTFVVAEFAAPGREEEKHVGDAEKLQQDVCRE
jgi:hypothetical protein